ncbi:MAG: hypothetical protein RMZ41_020980 [Nostoc sp. DedVER02]|uniref:hypothetical protein n=1 Tax=unclassified Nostoc TaxID=2593658 RepID=UPI002AD4F8CD|nr:MULTISPECIES: hypothetical protein [unclassified Nostoc]MDZ7986433.1 hypothetical protein [Nostoc sp. DedVER02]MDZ8114067.1 hypothetical protein [Nostoc sp. DedVER01b]
MFLGQIEREYFYGEIWPISQKTKLPDHLQLLIDQEEVKCDIWELQNQEPDYKPIHPSLNQVSSESRQK